VWQADRVSLRTRIEVLHGVNLDQLGRRDPAHYGSLSYDGLCARIERDAHGLGLSVRFFQSNFEGAFVEHLHGLDGIADGVVLNPGAWTHYSYAIRDALELCGLPAAEVHLSDVSSREEFRRTSVVSDLCLTTISGRGADGYAAALAALKEHLDA
jgi:3-dehydroquinate dehydratase II